MTRPWKLASPNLRNRGRNHVRLARLSRWGGEAVHWEGLEEPGAVGGRSSLWWPAIVVLTVGAGAIALALLGVPYRQVIGPAFIVAILTVLVSARMERGQRSDQGKPGAQAGSRCFSKQTLVGDDSYSPQQSI
jgi:hypothetical protein